MTDPKVDQLSVLRSGFIRLFETEKHTDFTIICGPYHFKVHKAIICAQSDYFNAACSNFSESTNNSITLKAIGEDGADGERDDEACDYPEAIKLMVHFFYHFDYTAEPLESSKESSEPALKEPVSSSAPSTTDQIVKTRSEMHKRRKIAHTTVGRRSVPSPPKPSGIDLSSAGNTVIHAKVFAAAIKYRVSALRQLAVTKFDKAASMNWDHPSFAEAAYIVYSTTAEDIRDLRSIVSRKIHKRREILNKSEMKAMLGNTNALVFELLRLAHGWSAVEEQKGQSEGNSSKKGKQCSACGFTRFDDACDHCGWLYSGCCGFMWCSGRVA